MTYEGNEEIAKRIIADFGLKPTVFYNGKRPNQIPARYFKYRARREVLNGKTFQELRNELGMTQTEVAHELTVRLSKHFGYPVSINPQVVSQWEHGQRINRFYEKQVIEYIQEWQQQRPTEG